MSTEMEEEQIIEDDFSRFIQPTEDELYRVIPEEDLVTLCRRVPCRVNLCWYNIVYDYKKKFAKEGRLQDKNEKQALKLIMKGVHRHLRTRQLLYLGGVIQKEQGEKWLQRKKYNVRSLDLWKHQAAKAAKEQHLSGPHHNSGVGEVPESDDGDVVAIDVNSLSITEAKAAKKRQSGPHDDVVGVFESEVRDMPANWINVKSQSLTLNTESKPINTESQHSNQTPKNSDLFYDDFDCTQEEMP